MASKRPAARKTAKAAGKKPAAKATRKSPSRAATVSRKAKQAVSRADLFVQEYLVDLNGAQAAIRAGYSPAAARQTASELLATHEVAAKVQQAMDERASRVGIEADDVLKRLWAIATADPRELIELHRGCCRFCWGKGHAYQYTRHELEMARIEHANKVAEARADNPDIKVSPLRAPGGIGFDPRKDPHPDCPECFGRGVEQVFPKDTRDLSPAAKLLYAGVKTTQHGLEIKMLDRAGMLVNVGKHLGMFAKKVEHSGKVTVNQSMADVLDEIDGAGTGLPAHGRGSS